MLPTIWAMLPACFTVPLDYMAGIVFVMENIRFLLLISKCLHVQCNLS